ncbi:MAG: hypothetical protein ACQEXO_05490 [Pseudomonadota bacterium]
MPQFKTWDGYFRNLTLHDFHARSPFLRWRRTPSVYNADESRLYLGSLDVDVAVNDYPQIEALLEEITNSFVREYDNLVKHVESKREEMTKRLIQGRQTFPIQLPDQGDYRRAQLKADMDELTELLSRRQQE